MIDSTPCAPPRDVEASGGARAYWLMGMAVGILMERHEISDQGAHRCLMRVAAAGRLEPWEVAREVVDRVNARAPTAVPQFDVSTS